MADLIAQQSAGTMRGSESGTSIVQVRVPEFKSVNFRVVKKRRRVVGIMGGDDKQDELREVLEKTWEDRTRVRSSVTLHVIGNEARDQVAVKGNKEFLKIQH